MVRRILVSNAEGKVRNEVAFSVYRQLHIRTSKTLTSACDIEGYDEDELRRSCGREWTEDCKKYGLQANGCLTITMFFDSMYQVWPLRE